MFPYATSYTTPSSRSRSHFPIYHQQEQQLPSFLSQYDVYDAHRTALEQRELAVQQQQRREAEARVFRQHQIEKEAARRLALQELYYQQQQEELARREQEEAEYRARVAAHAQARVAEVERRKAISLARARAEEEARQEYIRRFMGHQQHQEQQKSQVDPFTLFFNLLNGNATQPDSESDEEAAEEEQVVAQPTTATTSVPAVTVTSPSPTVESRSTPAPTTSTPPSEADEEAATTLQRRYRSHLARRSALKTLETLSTSLEAQRSSYHTSEPATLVFQPSPPSSSTEGVETTPSAFIPKLAYSSDNAPFLAYEDFLVGLLTKVDQVQSGGDRVVKTARKALVKRIEEELKGLDERKEGEFERVSSAASAGDKEEDVNMDEDRELEPLIVDESSTSTSSSPAATVTTTDVQEQAPTPSQISQSESAPSPAPSTVTDTETERESSNIASPSPSPVVEQGTSPTPLTSEALSSLPQSTRPARTANSDIDSSTESTSTLAVDFDEIVGNVLKAAGELGEKVERMELDESEGFVVV